MSSKYPSSSSTLSNKSSDRKRAGILFTVGASVFLLLTTAAESIYPNFHLQTNAISDLTAIGTSTTAIEETTILVFSICWILGAFYLFRNTGRRGLMIFTLLPRIGFFLTEASPKIINLIIYFIVTMG